MVKIMLTSGSMEVVGLLAVDLFGASRVDPGTWTTPVYADNLTEEEVQFAKSSFFCTT